MTGTKQALRRFDDVDYTPWGKPMIVGSGWSDGRKLDVLHVAVAGSVEDLDFRPTTITLCTRAIVGEIVGPNTLGGFRGRRNVVLCRVCKSRSTAAKIYYWLPDTNYEVRKPCSTDPEMALLWLASR